MPLNIPLNIQHQFQKSMEGRCLELLHQGYIAMYNAKMNDVDWVEDKLTVHYIAFMKSVSMQMDFQISIIPQFVIYNDEHAFGVEEVDTAPRIDFRFIKWFGKSEIDYFAEAKNLSERNWKKKSGKPVNANYYYKRYIETGIDHLLSGYYPSNCILLGYVVNGNDKKIVEELNSRVHTSFLSSGYGQLAKEPTSGWFEFYLSDNTLVDGSIVQLKHLILQLA